jgi:hypothetical protein
MKAPTAKKHPIIAVRRAGVPLIAFETSDPAQTIVQVNKALNGSSSNVPLLRWDIVRGLVGLNPLGQQRVQSILSKWLKQEGAGESKEEQAERQAATCDPSFTLNLLRKVAEDFTPAKPSLIDSGLIFFMNAHLFFKSEVVLQAMWNLRDALKPTAATLVVLCPAMKLPEELTHDVVVITEPLPNAEEVGVIVDSIAKDAKCDIDPADKPKVIDTVLGVSAFAAEQALAMSIGPVDGKVVLDRDELWERKRKMVENTEGLTIHRGKESFNDVGGLSNVKAFLTKILQSGNNPVRCIGFIDEIEKMFSAASTGGDMSGVSQDQLKVLLTEMQDNDIPGIIFVGPPGTGKSAVAKGAGSLAEAEVISIDTGAMTGSLVGQSQAKIRSAFATFKAVSQGKGLFIATCNKIAALPPELRRRFTLGTFYIDLPNAEERAAIWPLWLKKYAAMEGSKLTLKSEQPDDEGWTGAEIKACCDVAYRANISLKEAASYIVPVSKSSADQIKALRQMASGKFISASKAGIYQYVENEADAAAAASLDGTKRQTRRFGSEEKA